MLFNLGPSPIQYEIPFVSFESSVRLTDVEKQLKEVLTREELIQSDSTAVKSIKLSIRFLMIPIHCDSFDVNDRVNTDQYILSLY